MTKTRLALLAAASFLSAPAFAADDWTGWYLGANLAHGSADTEGTSSLGGQWSIEPATVQGMAIQALDSQLDPSGSLVGAQLGYAYQFSNNVVLGIEAGYSSANLDDTASGTGADPGYPALVYTTAHAAEIDDVVVLRGILGYAFGDNLIYATAGLSQADVTYATLLSSTGDYLKAGEGSESGLDGQAFGVGFAHKFGNDWSVHVEYTRHDFDELGYDTVYQPGSTFTSPAYTEHLEQSLDMDVFSLSVNYRF